MIKGVLLSVFSSMLFGFLYFYSTLLEPLNGEDIFAWRILFTLPFLWLFTWRIGAFHLVRRIWGRLTAQPALILVLLFSSSLIGIQLWLFLWAPMHGKALEVSLGYFMLPLTMVLTGRLAFKEKLSGWQKLATLSACVGVASELVHVGSFSFEAALVAFGYPVYFGLRRQFDLNHLGGLWFDMTLLLPAAIWFACAGEVNWLMISTYPALLGLIPLLGFLSALALGTYFIAARILSFSVFGLLGYVEPVLLLLVGLILGETIESAEWFTYGPIWLAVFFLVLEGALFLRGSLIKNAHTG